MKLKVAAIAILWVIGFLSLGIAIGGRSGPFNPPFFLIAIPVLLLAYYLQENIGKRKANDHEE